MAWVSRGFVLGAVVAVTLASACGSVKSDQRAPGAPGAGAGDGTGFPQLPGVVFDDNTGHGACYKADEFICEIELAIFRQTNELRAEGALTGRQPLKLGRKMSYSSRLWSKEMAERGRIGHGGFPRQRLADLAEEFGPQHGVRLSAENVAVNARGMQSAEEIARAFTRMWWRSPGHRRNMLSNNQVIGIGVHRSERGAYYATQMFGSE